MPARSKRSSKSKTLDRPVKPEVWNVARRVAEQYQVVLHQENRHWYGRGLELPYVFGDGGTPAKCLENTREAFAVAVAHLLEQGERPPTPASEGTRTQQVNVRLTADEKLLLETVANRKGFKGLSDFIRAAALESSR